MRHSAASYQQQFSPGGPVRAEKRAAGTGKSPRTGEKLEIAVAIVLKFSAGTGFKVAINKKK